MHCISGSRKQTLLTSFPIRYVKACNILSSLHFRQNFFDLRGAFTVIFLSIELVVLPALAPFVNVSLPYLTLTVSLLRVTLAPQIVQDCLNSGIAVVS